MSTEGAMPMESAMAAAPTYGAAPAKPAEATEQEKAAVQKWRKRVESELRRDRWVTFCKAIKRARLAAKGWLSGMTEGDTVRTNVIHSTLATLLPKTYAKNPEVAANPLESATQKYEWVRPFAKNLELVVNKLLTDGGLKRRAKQNVRSAMTTGLGWFKATYQRDYASDPIIQQRINDTQDNLARIQALIAGMKDGDDGREDQMASKAELEQQLRQLSENVEKVVSEGMVLERIKPENLIVDGCVEELIDYVSSGWMAQRAWYEKDAYETEFGSCDDKASKYDAKGDSSSEGRYCVWEIWDRTSNTVYTICDGVERYIREPYTPKLTGQRWFPFFLLAFNWVDGDYYPLSDVDLIYKLQEEYETTRTQQSSHREMSIPGWIGDQTTISIKDIKKHRDQVLGEIILIDTQGKPLNQAIVERTNPNYNPLIYDTAPIRGDIDFVSGASDAQRGAIVQAKTATEAGYVEQGLADRVEDRRDVIEECIAEMARYTAEIALEALTPAQVSMIVGADVPGSWPNIPRPEVFDIVQVEIRAGTTGKPNRAKELQAWGTLVPQIQQLQQQVVAAASQPQLQPLIEPSKRLIKETLRRLDERLDIEEFLPQVQPAAMMPALPGMPQGLPGQSPGLPGHGMPGHGMPPQMPGQGGPTPAPPAEPQIAAPAPPAGAIQ